MIKEKEFLGQRRVSVNMTTRKNGTRCCTGVIFYIPEENAGEEFYIKPVKNGFSISKNEKEGGYLREVKGNYNPLTKTCQTRLSFSGLVNETTLYDFYKTNEGYRLEKSTEQFSPNKKKGGKNKVHVLRNYNAVIPKNYLDRLCEGIDKDEYRLKIEETLYPTQAVKLSIIKAEEIPEYYTEKKLLLRKLDTNIYTRYRKISSNFHFSRFYVKAANLHADDILYCRWNGSSSLIIEKTEKCDICGRPINQGIESLMEMDICPSCDNAVKILKKYTDKNHDLRAVKQMLLEMKKEVESIITEEK